MLCAVSLLAVYVVGVSHAAGQTGNLLHLASWLALAPATGYSQKQLLQQVL